MRASLCLVLVFAALASAFSGTVPPTCDGHADYGCATWNLVEDVPDRLDCLDETPGIMHWVTKPVHTDMYSLRTGDGPRDEDPTEYTPGEFMTIHIRTLAHDQKYRGLLLYAVDSAGDHVGEWAVLEADKFFWAPWAAVEGDPCQQSVMHATAAIKPYHTYFRFMGPPAGTGDVTFVALIKTGDANTGEFWYPNGDGELTISEGVSSGSETDLQWIVSEVGQTCNEACEAVNRLCDSAEMESITSAEILDAEITTSIPCAYPLLSACSDFTPSTGVQDFCYYKDLECAADGRPTSPTECTSSSTDPDVGKLLCACSYLPSPSSEGSSTTEGSSTAEGSSTVVEGSSPSDEVISGSGSLSAPLLGLLGLLFLGRGRSISLGAVVLVALVLFSAPVSAHNWLNSLSRSPAAATILPCQARRSSSPHVQVARNQYFQVEWATGHGRDTYFTLIRASDADKMVEHHYLRLDAYLERSKADGNDFSGDPLYYKYHRSRSESASPVVVDNVVVGSYDSIVQPADSDFLERPAEFTRSWEGPGVLWRFSDADRATDIVSVGYPDQEMPWILGVWRYFIPYSRPSDSDVARFWIPQGLNLPEGEYILQYYWRGYGDCVDISYLDRDEPVEFVYGQTDPDGAILVHRRIDHCFFPDIQKAFAPAMEVVGGSVDGCLQRCVQRAGCSGVNVFPAQLPLSIFPDFRGEDNIFFQMANETLYVDSPQLHPTLDEAFRTEEAKQTLRDIWASSPDMMLCLPVIAREATDTFDKFVLSKDPEDPVFYSTCYEFDIKVDFIGYNISSKQVIEEGPWRFHDQCIDCEQRVRNYRDETIPIWSVAEKCVNCDREPADPEPLVPNGGLIPLRSDTNYCLGFTCDDTDCVKPLPRPVGWSRREYLTDPMACGTLVRADPECGNQLWMGLNPGASGCYCVRENECCGDCRTSAINREDWATWEFIDTAPADPACESGIPADDGTACCSSGCNRCDSTNEHAFPGVCRSTRIANERFCDEIGPPCYMRN